MAVPERFVVIGENIHTTRVVPVSSPRVGEDPEGRQAVVFTDADGATRHLVVPEAEKELQAYQEGRIKHVRIAVQTAMAGEGQEAETALAYLRAMAEGQVAAGAHYLDLNVDEVSLHPAEQVEAMRWLVRTVRPWAAVPLSIDSSNPDTLRAGIEAAAGDAAGPPMLNSASLERVDAFALAAEAGGPVIVTSAGESGIPNDADGRVENATKAVELALGQGVPLERVYVDPLVFPISVDASYGSHVLESFRRLRARFGPEIHLTGGMSNVSFGLPNRTLVNDAFLVLAVEAGADSGIIDPIQNNLERVFSIDRTSRPFRLATDVLTGVDQHCRAYIKAWRAGELEAAAA
ncbi:MAG: dihydropteroate synthase [Thermoleophilia bacterium]|nr:dihydropteroate synthase [Thermoleophilia bacterium]